MRSIFSLLLILLTTASFSSVAEEQKYSQTDLLDRPLMERYILDELKSLRESQQDLERRLVIDITNRELAVADKSLNYANVTVTYFFYIIAGVASLIAFVGWQSIRELKVNTKEMADKRLEAIAQEYEKKFIALERDLKRKTRIISENNKEIEIINEVHNLWLRAQSMQTPEQKIAVYDEILHIRPGDLEALTYKADAAMEANEYNWALSICNRVLDLDESNGPALYQRACAFARLG
ncbi:TPR repeat containing protein [Vibrio ponticus]|nr:TPR repeat containing protein [Vibrio ponticus]